jgi:hypothetical protein
LAPILEVEKLPDEFAAGLLFVEGHGFKGWAVVLDESIAPCDFAPFAEDIISPSAVLGIKVTEAGKGLHWLKDGG